MRKSDLRSEVSSSLALSQPSPPFLLPGISNPIATQRVDLPSLFLCPHHLCLRHRKSVFWRVRPSPNQTHTFFTTVILRASEKEECSKREPPSQPFAWSCGAWAPGLQVRSVALVFPEEQAGRQWQFSLLSLCRRWGLSYTYRTSPPY